MTHSMIKKLSSWFNKSTIYSLLNVYEATSWQSNKSRTASSKVWLSFALKINRENWVQATGIKYVFERYAEAKLYWWNIQNAEKPEFKLKIENPSIVPIHIWRKIFIGWWTTSTSRLLGWIWISINFVLQKTSSKLNYTWNSTTIVTCRRKCKICSDALENTDNSSENFDKV